MPRHRLIAPLAVLLSACAPAVATAATTSTYAAASPKTLTLQNDGDSETFTISSTPGTPYFAFTITAANANIPVPAGTMCTNADGGKTLVCSSAQSIDRVVLDGGAGNDTFTINSAAYESVYSGGIVVSGGAGADTFTAGPNGALLDTVSGGEGDDTFNGGTLFGDRYKAEPGNDTYRGGTKPVPPGYEAETYQTRHANDAWRASGAGPVNVSLDGVANDTDGLGGTDNVVDVDTLGGSDGNDTLTAGSAAIRLEGGSGDDTLTGSPDADTLPDSDILKSGGGSDTVFDGDFDAQFRLASDPAPTFGNDTIDTGDGDDVMTVGGGKDDVHGGGGTDTIFYPRIETQVVDAEPAYDTVALKWRPMTVSLDDQPNDGPTGAGEGDNVHADIENVDTSEGAGGIVYDRSARRRISQIPPYLEAVIADDTITGNGANNIITTGFGNDTVDPGAGADIVDLGGGDDKVMAIDKVTDAIECGKGADVAAVDIAGTNAPRADALSNCETVTGTALGLEGGVLPTLPVAPKVTLGGPTTAKVKAFLRTYTVTTQVTSDQSATVTGELSTTGAKIAKVGALTIGGGTLRAGTGTRKLKVAVRVKYRKALKRKLKTKKQRKKGIKLALAVKVKNASGQVTTSTRTIKVRG